MTTASRLLLLLAFAILDALGAGGHAVAAPAFPCSSSGPHPWIVPDAVFTANALGDQARLRGAGLAPLFATVGVTISSDPRGTLSVTDDRDVYGGAVVDDATAWRMFGVQPSTSSVWHNVLIQSAAGHPASFTLTLAQPVLAVRFLRAALIAGPTGVTHPEWTATAFDAKGNVVASVHEDQIASYSPVPPRSYDLVGTGPISSVTFAGDNHAFAAFTNLVVQLIGWCR